MPIDPSAASLPPNLLTPDDVAEVLRVSKTSVYRLVERREIRFYRVCGLLRFDSGDVERFLRAGSVEPMGK
jgi:excisionase family DNA binding protein